jgi:hypothetical protein
MSIKKAWPLYSAEIDHRMERGLGSRMRMRMEVKVGCLAGVSRSEVGKLGRNWRIVLLAGTTVDLDHLQTASCYLNSASIPLSSASMYKR